MALTASIARPLRLRSRDGHEPGRKVTWLELFFDLVFVAAVSQVGTPLGVDYSLPSLGRFAVLFALIWWAWHGHTTYATRFDTDDVIQRVLTLLQMFAVAAMAVNAKDALDSRDSAGFAAAYAVMRLVLVAQYLRAWRIREVRALTAVHVAGFGSAAVIWLASALTPAPVRFWLWGLGLVIDFATPLFTTRLILQAPPDAAHLPERFGLFTIILMGDAVVGVMRGMESQAAWPLDAALSAFLGMVVVFLTWWWYFDGATAAEERVLATERDARRFHIWTYAHVPLYLGIAVAGVGIHHTISVAAMGHLHATESWILCGAVALMMAAMTVISEDSRPAVWLLASATLACGALGPLLPCSLLMGMLATLLAAQVRMTSVRRAVSSDRNRSTTASRDALSV